MSVAPPTATYRIQLTPSFGFAHAASVTPYLARLGVSHLYLSPIFEAVPGSAHGYDQTDPTTIRRELGGAEGFALLADAARSAGLGIVLDIVPNHMAAHYDNPWWRGLLAEGRDSPFNRFFDVDWDAADGRVVLPALGKPLPQVVADGDLVIDYTQAEPALRYFDRLFPLRAGSFDTAAPPPEGAALLRVLERQCYQLEYWRSGLERINYRRFFDIADLAGVRADDPEVFDTLHRAVLSLVRDGLVDGLRVDHVDGLANPRAYCRRLRARVDESAPAGRRVWILVEKILAGSETLATDWGVDGTTGYDFLAAATETQVSPGGLQRLRTHAVQVRAAAEDFETLRVQCKAAAARLLRPELARIGALAGAALRAAGVTLSRPHIQNCLVAVCSQMLVYRTYADDRGMPPADAERVRSAVALAARNLDEDHASALSRLAPLLRLAPPFDAGPARAAAMAFLIPWQQFTGPVAAKGVEDTALYRDMAMPALNDVGCEPAVHDADARMRALLSDRTATSPLALNATATHDTKRGEDTRVRIAALSWRSEDAIDALSRAAAQCEPLRPRLPPGPAPGDIDLALILHTLTAIMPLDAPLAGDCAERLKTYIRKAAREAKLRTAWLDPNSAYESACEDFIDRLLASPAGRPTLETLRRLARGARPRAAMESLAMVALKILSPGVPDIYQGCEFADLSLVDPDNRRPVDWASRAAMLERIASAWRAAPAAHARDVLAAPGSDAAKMLITWRALALRRRLMTGGSAIEVTEFTSDRDCRRWRFRAGERSGEAVVQLEPARGAAARPHTENGVDQLSGHAADLASPGLPITIILHGVHELIDFEPSPNTGRHGPS